VWDLCALAAAFGVSLALRQDTARALAAGCRDAFVQICQGLD